MESVQATADDGDKLTKKPSGVSSRRRTPADDGGGHLAPSPVDAKNGNGLSHAAPSTRIAVLNGRGLSGNSGSLLLRRRRLKRNLSAATAASSSAASSSAVTATACCGAKMSSALSSASLHTRSLDRKTLLKHRQNMQLQLADREWVRADLHRGAIHVYDRLTSSYPRPVLCTVDTTAGEVALRLNKLCGKSSSVMRIFSKDSPKLDQNGNCSVKYEYSYNLCKVNEDPTMKYDHLSGLVATDLGSHASDKMRLLLMTNADERQKQQDGKLFTPESESQDNITCSLSDLNLNSNMDTPNDESEHRNGVDSYGLNSGSDVESSTFDDLSSGARLSEHRDSLSDDMILGTDASILSPSFDSATEGNDMYGSSSDELELDCPASSTSLDPINQLHSNGASYKQCGTVCRNDVTNGLPTSSSAGSLSRDSARCNTPDIQDPDCGIDKSALTSDRDGSSCDESIPTLYVQLHGVAVRRLSPDERPLQIQNDFLFKLGFKDPWRVQEEGLNTEMGSLLRFYAGKPQNIESLERVQLSGTYNVRKGKLQLPVNRWTRRQVILCGTCLIVSSVKESQTGKMHILPLIGGKVEEVKKHNHCLAFSSAGPQSQTYYVSFDSFTEHLRWHRHAAKMVSQRINSVDLSCCSLEQLPPNLFYSHDLTHLNLKHNFLPADQWLQQLQRFSRLRSLNLSNNHLGQFPLAICDIPTLTEVNLSCNYLPCVPIAVGAMTNLQTFLLDGNSLSELPDELGSLQRLSYLGLSFNQFILIPQVLERLVSMEKLCMAGNNLETLTLQNFRLLRVKHVDLRLNKISNMIPDEPDLLRHVTQLDVRDNRLTHLDASVFPRLEVLHCERNQITSLKVKGCLLKGIYASNNELQSLDVSPMPSNLSYMDISRNHMESLPDWLCEAKKLEVLDASHNLISELPARLLCSSSLRKLSVGHNQLQKLPERVERPLLEVLDVHHNQLVELPCNLFLKSVSLRCVNASANKLEHLPPSTLSEESHSILQELYLTNNRLTDKCVPMLTGHSHLRVLHMAYNHLQTFPASKMAKLEELEEVDLSGNTLKTVPTTIMNCRRMHTLIAHSNAIEVFPEVMQLLEMKCVDLSCNELSEITLPENLPPKLQELDLTGNPRLNLDHKTLEQLNNIRCFRIDPPLTFSSNEAPGGPAVWSHGYTEASGVKNKLCVAALSVNRFCGSREALYGVFDGDRNVEVPCLLQCTMNDILAEELHKTKSEEDYMTNTFLVMQRKLGTAGQKLGGSAALCHIRHDPTDPSGCFVLTAANVGKCQAILCRNGKPLSLSLLHNVSLDEEYRRIRQHRAIITEDNKVNGVTDSTRIMGYSFLYPSVIPSPYVQTVTLTPQDEFFILGSRGLWDAVSPTEAVEAVRNVPDALAAAKKLCTLAQGYGCTDSLSAVVVQLSVSEDCCSCCCSEPPQPPPSPSLGPYPPSSSSGIKERPSDGSLPVPPSSCSEISSEISTSEMSSEVGSTASSDEPPQSSLVLLHDQPHHPHLHMHHQAHPMTLQHQQQAHTVAQPCQYLFTGPDLPSARNCCTLHPACLASSFQRQLSSATFSSALSDNGLDSEDEEPIAGVFSNGSRVEVEADVHCLKQECSLMPQASQERGLRSLPPPPPPPCTPEPLEEGVDMSIGGVENGLERDESWQGAGDTSKAGSGKRRVNGSVARQEKSHNLIEVAAEAPSKKSGGYFTAPAQPDPDDQFIIPPELEEEVKEIMKQHQQKQQKPPGPDQPADYFDTPL
ncbi:PH domain leucine-rich repeat-containing protein phosphatase 1 [Dunckerocampus dactyliophorus]|uniref:PH domain leucine-rich repeat-containing protein phosphatase 1 n=1 Tax=Dunckerocampus dactyliophorus TaxID=161453 RepID=UPI0024068F46|nr:PH domain leucine-rich repeat-containing protein phosphatase 1 [Dunckerocampus dactyliophorus]XP_054624202.1 PH domain leucine-rich repeat-containing protein phosphatase 1 [Dunckerocampus dactyliophorus]XP_054624203.1 PH domain leucine-rich repeat-containing protein phosphatase 1 [Dunckerocampus dactyliophorus]